MVTMIVIGVLVVVLAGLIMLAAALLLPAASQAAERVRIEREAAEASWRIHQQASDAFGQLLDAARNDPRQEEGQ